MFVSVFIFEKQKICRYWKGMVIVMEFAKSLSGHDKNQYYLILKKEGRVLFLVNGTTRLLENPKKKNQKHVQVIKKLPDEILQILEREQSNLTIKRAMKEYKKFVTIQNKSE